MTQEDVAAAMDWSPSKVIRIESGEVSAATNDLRMLLTHYGETDQQVVDDLVRLGQESKRLPWDRYRPELGQRTVTYYNHEASATSIRQFDPLVVPALCQTREYARAYLRDVLDLPDETVELRQQVLAGRQELLDAADAPGMVVVLDEAVLHRETGGAATMAAQRQHLRDLDARPQVTVRVVPFGHPGHPGLQGPYALLDLGADDTALYRENGGEPAARKDAGEIARYSDGFGRLAAAADDLATILKKLD
jgi:hypothetical protein